MSLRAVSVSREERYHEGLALLAPKLDEFEAEQHDAIAGHPRAMASCGAMTVVADLRSFGTALP